MLNPDYYIKDYDMCHSSIHRISDDKLVGVITKDSTDDMLYELNITQASDLTYTRTELIDLLREIRGQYYSKNLSFTEQAIIDNVFNYLLTIFEDRELFKEE